MSEGDLKALSNGQKRWTVKKVYAKHDKRSEAITKSFSRFKIETLLMAFLWYLLVSVYGNDLLKTERIVEGNLKKLGTKFNHLTITMGIFYFECHFVRSTQKISVNWKVCNPSEYFSFLVKCIKTLKGLGQLTSLCCI